MQLNISLHQRKLTQSELKELELLVGLTAVTLVEAVCYAWIEVLLYSSDNPILYNTWLFGHYTTYHVILVILVSAMIFGVGYVAFVTYSKSRFRKFLLLSLGNFILWTMMEDEFTFIFTGSPHTLTDWTNWPIGAVRIFGYYIPDWYVLATASIFLCWFFGLALTEEKQTELATQ